MIVTIDGPAGAGKTTVARHVAGRLGLPYLNSGAIYRAVTLRIIEEGRRFGDRAFVEALLKRFDFQIVESAGPGVDPRGSPRVFSDGRDVTDRLGDRDVTRDVWRVAGDAGYRALLVDLQRRFARTGGVVAEGRDMGSVIFPEARVKVYLDASLDERARRRHLEDGEAGRGGVFEEVRAALAERDARDRGRETAPLVVPEGAVVIDTETLAVEEVVQAVLDRVRTVAT